MFPCIVRLTLDILDFELIQPSLTGSDYFKIGVKNKRFYFNSFRADVFFLALYKHLYL